MTAFGRADADEFVHFEHASTPSFEDAAAVEHFGDPWVV